MLLGLSCGLGLLSVSLSVKASESNGLPTLEGTPASTQQRLPAQAVPMPASNGLSSGTAAPVSASYLLGVGDLISLDVFNIPDYSGEFQVLSNGALNIPVVGAVAVEGLSTQQAATRVEQALAPYIRRPRVTLSILAARPLQIAIVGEVNRPGAYQVSASGEGQTSPEVPTLTQAIELAGGITQLANIREIEVQRRLPSQLSTDIAAAPTGQVVRVGVAPSQFQSIRMDLWALLSKGSLEEDLRLQDGDRIAIPTATTLDAAETAQLASASFSPDQITINVVGEVASPGIVTVPPNTPLNQAILAAGGFNNRAQTGFVRLVRLNPNGTASQEEIDIDFSQGINDEFNPFLRPNDTVIVQRSGIARVGDTVRTLFSPVTSTLRLLQLFGL